MNITVVGCGKIGVSIIESLINEDHDVTVIDDSEAALAEVKNQYDVISVCGNCTDVNVLKEAGVGGANLFIAVTGRDETNMLSCYFAKKLGAKYSLARIREAEYNESAYGFIRRSLELDYTINPEAIIAGEIFNILSLPTAAKAQFFSSKKLEMVELKLREDSVFAGKTLIETRKMTKAQFLVCAVQRGEDVFIPNGNFTLNAGDKVALTATRENFGRLFVDMNLTVRRKKGSVLLFGGSRISAYLAKELYRTKSKPVIIDRDPEICAALSARLDGVATIVHADGSRKEVLREYGLGDAPAFVALTGFDEENILMSYFAMKNGVPAVVAKVNSFELAKTAEQIGVETIVNPKSVVSDLVIRYARALQNTLDTKVETLYGVLGHRAEALEFIVGGGFRGTDVPLAELKLKNNVLIAGIVRNNEMIIPGGNDAVKLGDSVVIVTTVGHIDNLNSILA